LKSLVVGYGSIGSRHVKNLLAIPNMEVIICTKRKGIEKIEKKCQIFKTLNEALKQNPDFAIIANVSNLHIPTAIQIAKKGIDIFIEKPLSNSTKGIKELEDLVRKKKLITMMGCNLRFHKSIKKIKELISNNEIGKIISVHSENGSYLPDWHPYENYSNGYAARKDLGGGVVLTCIHEIDYLYWLFGDVKETISINGKFSDLKIIAADLASIVLKFKNEIITEIHLDYFQRPATRNCKIIGTKGTIFWDSKNNNVMVYNIKNKKWSAKFKIKSYDNNSMYEDEISHYIECVKRRKRSINPINEGVKTLKIALAIIKSSKTKRMEKP
jgi:predicted dehydrogenase